MRILHVLPTRALAYGGPVRIAEAMVQQLRARGHDAALYPNTPDDRTAVSRLGYWKALGRGRDLLGAVRGADVVHIHGLWTLPTSAAGLLARSFGIPYVVTLHGMLDRWSLARSSLKKRVYSTLIERRMLDQAAALLVNHLDEQDEGSEFGLRAPTFILPTGTDIEAFRNLPSREVLEARHPQLAGKVVVLFLGRIHPKKGVDVLVNARALVSREVPNLHLVIAGPDEVNHRAEVEALIRRHQLQSAVTFTGPVLGEDKRMLLGGADLFVLPSHQEGDSVALKEALAAGLPVIITPGCHLAEAERAGAGVVVPAEPAAVGRALARIGASAKLRQNMAQASRSLAEAYRWEVLAGRLAGLYESVATPQSSTSESQS